MPRGPLGVSAQMDRTAFAEEVMRVIEEHGDVASEQCWQEFSKVLAQYWLVFSGDQSPLSTWAMVAKCTETILKIRLAQRSLRGEGGADALEAFRSFMEDVTGADPADPDAV